MTGKNIDGGDGFRQIYSSRVTKTSTGQNHVINFANHYNKWHRFSTANGYSEFDIDSQYVVFYNHKVGWFKLPYKIENDSLKYLTKDYVAKITNYGDSVLLEGNDSTQAILHRFKEPHIPFETIPEQKDSLSFASYIADFDKRLISEFEKAGIKISNVTEKREGPAYEELLKRKSANR